MTGTRRGTGQPPRSGQGRFLRAFDRDVDPYLAKRKITGPAVCPDCKAVYWRGKWTWREAAPKTKAHVCPACQRVRDKVPAAYLTLRGEFRRAHEKEILNLIHNFEAHERKEHPLKRIMSSEQAADALVFTFTDSHLARGIAEALHHAYQGDVDLQYTTDDVMLRATWTR